MKKQPKEIPDIEIVKVVKSSFDKKKEMKKDGQKNVMKKPKIPSAFKPVAKRYYEVL